MALIIIDLLEPLLTFPTSLVYPVYSALPVGVIADQQGAHQHLMEAIIEPGNHGRRLKDQTHQLEETGQKDTKNVKKQYDLAQGKWEIMQRKSRYINSFLYCSPQLTQ